MCIQLDNRWDFEVSQQFLVTYHHIVLNLTIVTCHHIVMNVTIITCHRIVMNVTIITCHRIVMNITIITCHRIVMNIIIWLLWFNSSYQKIVKMAVNSSIWKPWLCAGNGQVPAYSHNWLALDHFFLCVDVIKKRLPTKMALHYIFVLNSFAEKRHRHTIQKFTFEILTD